MTPLPRSVLLVGAGKMGSALLKGWLAKGMDPRGLAIVDPHVSDEIAALAGEVGFAANPDLAGRAPPAVLVLAVKPQMLAAAASALSALRLGDALVLSIMAGKTLADIGARVPGARAIVRAMPNTPAAVGRGIAGAYANPAVSPAQKAVADAMLSAVGQVVWLDREAEIDAVTAVSGSGPAYVFLLTECLAEAARGLGLAPAVADRLARATVEGAGALMEHEPSIAPEQLRRNVTSPGGTTAAALDVLQRDDAMARLIAAAVGAARARAVALSG